MLSQYQVIPQRMGRSMIAVGMLLTVLATSAFAQALDTPSISQTGGGFFRIDIDVHAGATGAPHGFVVQWMTKSNYDLFGFPADEYDPRAAYCDFIGTPTLNTDGRSASYLLDPSGVTNQYGQNVVLWNTTLGKKFLKDDRGELRVTATDVLRQDRSVGRSFTESYIQDSRDSTLGRFVQAVFTYTFR